MKKIMKNTIAIALAVILVAGCFMAAGDPTAYAASKWSPKKTMKYIWWKPMRPAPAPAPAPTEPVAPAPTEPVAPAPTEPVAPAPTPTEPVAPAPTEPIAPAPTEPVAPAPTEPVAPAPIEPVVPPVVEPIPPATPTPEAIVLPAAKNYLYVATTGSDSNNGSAEAPFRTIQKAANVAKAGDAVLIREGTYKEKVKPANSGNATDGHILFANYNGEVVTIDGTGISVAKGTALFDVAYRSYIKVEGLRIINSSWTGFGSPYASPGSTRNIVIKNCFISNTQSSGINLSYGKDILIDGNTIQYANTLPASQGGSDEALTVGATDGFVISNNYLSNMGKEGIDAKGGANNGKIFGNVIEAPPIMGIYIDAFHASQSNIEIYNNTINNAVHNGIVLAIEYNGTLSDIKVHHNTINKAKRGISVTTYGSSPYVMNNIIIDQNTMVGTTICGLDLSNDEAKSVTITKNYFGGTSTSIPIYNNGGYIPANGFVIDGNKLNRVVTGHPTGTNYSLI